ncbi:MAG: GNAT family N-acetyltransferase [Bryobacteraceae bacterium]
MSTSTRAESGAVEILSGDRVYLRRLRIEDTDDVLRWRSDPAAQSQLFSERPPTRAEHESWFATLKDREDRKEFVIVLRGSDRRVGAIGLSHINGERMTAEYGILIGEADCRGKGYAREASVLILDYAFYSLALERVELNMFADNEPARGLYKALGFIDDLNAAGRRVKDGVVRATARMRISKDDWFNNRGHHGIS